MDTYSISNMSAYHQFVVASFDQYYEHRHNFYPFIKDIERFYDSFFKEWKVKFKKLNILSIAKNNKAGHYYPLLGDFKINNSNENILIFHEDRVIKYNHSEFTKSSRIRSVTQGGLKTEIEYKELDPTKNPNFYSSIKKEKFPYMEIDKLSNSFVVAQLRQEVSHNQIRKQDFRYRGFTTHLQGKGMIGFRQTARSSWYTDDLVSTKIWSGVETDPLQESIPIKEWTIKTNDENQIFPQDISDNNTGLLSFKSTIYKTDKLLNGNIVHTNQIAQSDKAKVVTATVPIQSFTKDFQINVSSTSTIKYGEYYLPTKTTTNINKGYSISETILKYSHNSTGIGKNYFVGRPKSKTETIRTYGDTKGSKEDYEYENNLLKFTKTYNRDNSAWVQESYTYDGFGNIIQKTLSNSTDAFTKTEKSRYEDKGRFVIKKTDNLGLETLISYNNWGQVVSQISPLGTILTNTYDTWGKLLTSKTNLGGTTSYTYEKLFNGDTKVI